MAAKQSCIACRDVCFVQSEEGEKEEKEGKEKPCVWQEVLLVDHIIIKVHQMKNKNQPQRHRTADQKDQMKTPKKMTSKYAKLNASGHTILL